MINVSQVTKLVNGIPLYEKVSFQINPGEKVGLVGPNGSGKTTFFNLIVGSIRPDEGQIAIDSNIRVSYFKQNVEAMKGKTALQEVVSARPGLETLSKKLKEFEEKLCAPNLSPEEMELVLEKMGNAQSKFESIGGYEVEFQAAEVLSGLGIKEVDHQKMVEDFSGGWKMRIELAKVLVSNPDLILMDEPTNYLDMETILWLEEWLKSFKGAVFMTSHDRFFMNKVVNKIVELSANGVFTYTGDYDFYEKEVSLRKKTNEAHFAKQQANLKKEEEFIAKFKARASHAAQVQSRVKKLEKIDRVELESDMEQMKILLPKIDRGGNDVAVVKSLSKKWSLTDGSENLVFENLNATIQRQEKIAVVGVNGAGKSTLLNIIRNATEPTSGNVKIGPSIKWGYFGKEAFDKLGDDFTVFEQLQADLPNSSDGLLRNILAAFLFKGDDVFKKVKYLSGGEKSRVILAALLSTPYNFLILDEPTNHLDIGSREVLLDALQRFEGTLMFVSHDRHFLTHLCTKVLEVDKSKIFIHQGNYNSYLESKI